MIANVSNKIIYFLAGLPMFERVNSEELRIIAKHMSVMEMPPGNTLFNEGDDGDYICFIEKGALEVLKISAATGKNVALASLGKGQSIGEMSVIENSPRSATIKSLTESRLFILSKSAFDLILERNSRIGIKLIKGISLLLSRNLRDTSERLAEYIPHID